MWKWRLFLSFLRWTSGDATTFFRRVRGLYSLLTEELNKLDSSWITLRTRPKRPLSHEPILDDDSRVAVVLQGPLLLEDEFTLRTLQHYQCSMPGAQLIVSTWDDSDRGTLRQIEALGVDVVLSEIPSHPGPLNVNRQLCSTRAGLQRAAALGYRHALKTRTDTRLGSYHVLDYLAGLSRSFPLAAGTPQRERIVVLDLSTRLLVPNHPADMLMFGATDDLLAYWSAPDCPLQTRSPDARRIGGLWNEQTPEVYLCEQYLRRIGHPFERTIESWWRTLAELFVVVDRASLDFFWPKYCYTQEHTGSEEDQLRAMALCSFREWMNLYTFPKRLALSDADLGALRCDEILRAA